MNIKLHLNNGNSLNIKSDMDINEFLDKICDKKFDYIDIGKYFIFKNNITLIEQVEGE